MITKKIGWVLIITGIIIGFALSVLQLFDDGRFGPFQILIAIVGAGCLLTGVFLVFHIPNMRMTLIDSARNSSQLLLNLPVSAWVITGFAVVYLCLFISPLFLNLKHEMQYFINYIPNSRPIGLDDRDTLRYIENWLVAGQSPYYDKFILYPPLVLILLAPLILLGYPVHYFVMVGATLGIYILAGFVAFRVRRKQDGFPFFGIVFILSLFSYGLQFELERGQFNVIAYSLALIAVFLFYENDSSRYPAYFLFTLGVQMKLYPLILILFFIGDWRDWKMAFKRIAGLLVINGALLFVAGYHIFLDFLRSISARQMGRFFDTTNHSVKSFVARLSVGDIRIFNEPTLMWLQKNQSGIDWFLFLVLGACVVALVVRAYMNKGERLDPALLVVCTICALVIPSTSHDYKLPILTIPMILFWSDIRISGSTIRKMFTILLVIISSIGYWVIQYPPNVKLNFLGSNLLTSNFPALFLIAVIAVILRFMASEQQDNYPDIAS